MPPSPPSRSGSSRTIAITGCLDTKGEEVGFLARVLREEGCASVVIDTGVVGPPALEPAVSSEEVARAAGTSLAELRARDDRGHAVKMMSAGAASIVRRLHDESRIHGIIAAGGSANTTIGTAAMRALPVGFPKVMVSTLASGDVAHYVGTRDIAMMYSVVDIAGLNRISVRVLANGARAVAAMAAERTSDLQETRPLVAATMFGVTTPCVTEARKALEEAGYEVVVFHATGSGGRAMEDLMEDGFISGVLDITTTELADELVGGVLSAGPRRLTVAGAVGIPQVVSVGAIDMVNFGPRGTVPEAFAGRTFYEHNPSVTLMRTTAAESSEIGRRIATRLQGAKGPVEVLVPLRGVSAIDVEGGVFHDPAADEACRRALREGNVPLRELDHHINDPEFARACAGSLIAMLRASAGTSGKRRATT